MESYFGTDVYNESTKSELPKWQKNGFGIEFVVIFIDKLYRTFFEFMVMLLIIGNVLVPDCAVFALPTLWNIVVDGYSFIHLIKEEVCMKLLNIKTTTTNSFTCGGAEASRCVAYSVVRCQVNVS